MSGLHDVVEMLPPCPKCGAKAEMRDLGYEGRIQCSESNTCYGTKYYVLDGRYQYGYMPLGNTREEKWMWIMSEWTRLALEYPKKKAYRNDLMARRCECGKVVPKGSNYCPKCGKQVMFSE